MNPPQHSQKGASLLEVLVAILILSFGMLALGAMLSLSVQLPKLAAYRATATHLASSHIERIRANPDGFKGNNYTVALSYDGTFNDIPLADCIYDQCSPSTLAIMDNAATQRAIRMALPAGGMMLSCDPTPCTPISFSSGNLWIVWQEPSTSSSLDPSSSDNCPTQVTETFNTDPKPRCLYVRFKP